MSPDVQRIVDEAIRNARSAQAAVVDLPHLALALTDLSRRHGASSAQFDSIETLGKSAGSARRRDESRDGPWGSGSVPVSNAFRSWLLSMESVVPTEDFPTVLETAGERLMRLAPAPRDDDSARRRSGRDEREQPEVRPPATLPSYAFEFTPDVLERFEPYIGNENLVRLTLGVLARRRKRHPVLVGEAGVGKTALVVELARRIAAGQAPDRLKGARVFQVDLGTAVAGTRYRGDFEERMAWLSRQLLDQEKSIFFIDEVHLVLNVGGGEGGIDAASLLKPALSSGVGALIGATTREQARHLEGDAPLARRLVFVPVGEASPDLTRAILTTHAQTLEEELSINVPTPVIDAALEAALRLRPHRHLPDSAIDILELAVSLAAADTPRREQVEPDAIGFVADFMTQGITTYANKGPLRSASRAVGRFFRRGPSRY